jgi:N-acetylglutamate synthase-like GNAT family acetyltransferase
MFEIINDAAQVYRGVIPEDCWNEPYMSSEELRHEIEDGVVFWGLEHDGQLLGVMGIQDKNNLTLIRHAYIRTQAQKLGIGTRLLQHLENIIEKPILIGTWAAASWAISFYEKNGYTPVSDEEKNRLLGIYWSIPERQIETSVVLANQKWKTA